MFVQTSSQKLSHGLKNLLVSQYFHYLMIAAEVFFFFPLGLNYYYINYNTVCTHLFTIFDLFGTMCLGQV